MRYVFIICLIIWLQNLFAGETVFIKQVRQWFEWGEYPQIIETVPGYLSDSTQVHDSLSDAQMHLYLGVAYFAEGEIGKARNEFFNSLQLDPAIILDKNYVSGEILDLFSATVTEMKQREDEKKEQALFLKKQNEQVKSSKQAAIDSLDRSVKKARKRGLIISAIATSVLSVATAGYAGYEYYLGEQDYEEFRSTAKRGDYIAYTRLKEDVRQHDIRTVISGSVSGVSALTSIILYIVAHRQREKRMSYDKRDNSVYFSFNISNNALYICSEF